MAELQILFVLVRLSTSCAHRDIQLHESGATRDLGAHVSNAVKGYVILALACLASTASQSADK